MNNVDIGLASKQAAGFAHAHLDILVCEPNAAFRTQVAGRYANRDLSGKP